MKRVLCLLLVVLASSVALAETSAQDYCQKVRAYARDVGGQLPMRMDSATTWAEISAIYSQGKCRVYHRYILDSSVLIESVAQHSKSETREQVEARLSSSQGMEQLKQTIRESVRRRIPEVMSVPNVVYQADYSSTGPLDSFIVELTTGGE